MTICLFQRIKMQSHITQSDQNVPNEITQEMIYKAVNDYLQGNVEHRFRDSRDYDVIIDGNRYPPKAIIGLASRYIIGRPLTPDEFSAGVDKKCFKVLKDLGFHIVPKHEEIYNGDEVKEYREGSTKSILVNKYERDRQARDKCLSHYKNLNCQICGFNFEETYGDLGVGFIHVHHKVPLHQIKEEYEIDPIRDLIPVCPNCHAMLHRDKNRVLTVEELKILLMQKY